MKCSRCCLNTKSIICQVCYQQNSKQHEPRRKQLLSKFQQVKKRFQQLVQQATHLGQSLGASNNSLLTNHSQNVARESLQNKKDALRRKIKQNQLLGQRIKSKKEFLQKIERQTKRLRLEMKQKERAQSQLKRAIQNRCIGIKSILQARCGWVLNCLKQNRFNCSKQQWLKFVNMQEEKQQMYSQLMESQYSSQITAFHTQIQSQMVALSTISQLLGIALPYKMDLKLLFQSHSNALLFSTPKQGRRLNKQRLRQFQANTVYVFSRFNTPMQYPQIDEHALSTIIKKYIEEKLHIAEDLTKAVYISSLELKQELNKPISAISGITVISGAGMVSQEMICGPLQQLKADHLQRYNERMKSVSLQQQETDDIDYTLILEISCLKSFDSDQDIEILE